MGAWKIGKTQIKALEKKTTTSEIRNTLYGKKKNPNKNTLRGISDNSEKNILLTLQKMSDLEDIGIKSIQN